MRRVTAICYVFESKFAEIIALGFILLRHVRKVFKHLPSIAFWGFVKNFHPHCSAFNFFFRFFEPHDTHITCKLPNPDRMSSFPLSDFLINFCVFMGYDGADKRSLKARKCIFSWMPGERLTQLNLFSVFNIKNMCLETTSFPCILVRIVSSSLVRTLILIIFRNINRVSLGSKFFIREKNVSRLQPVCTQRDQRCENLANAVFVFHPRRGKNFNFPIFTRRRSCSRFNERLADAAPDENR